MQKQEFLLLEKSDNFITEADLSDKSDRTLILGDTCERETFHVYLKNGEIFNIIYKTMGPNGPIGLRSVSITVNQEYLPDKRIYPEACDYEFCRLLQRAGCFLPFTYCDDDAHFIKQDGYYGYVAK